MTDDLTQHDLENEAGELLPEREAMSLVSADPIADFGGIPMDSPDALSEQPAGDATGAAADDASGLASDAAASESGEESVTDGPRSETYSSTDTATAQT